MSTTTAGRKPLPLARESAAASTNTLRNFAELGGRALLSVLFLVSGLGKIGSYTATAGYMAAMGVPSTLLPVVIVTEVLGAFAIIAGWRTRITAFLLAGFTLLSAAIFHSNFADQVQLVMFLKNVSITGGFLLLVANGAGRLSVDSRRDRAIPSSTREDVTRLV